MTMLTQKSTTSGEKQTWRNNDTLGTCKTITSTTTDSQMDLGEPQPKITVQFDESTIELSVTTAQVWPFS